MASFSSWYWLATSSCAMRLIAWNTSRGVLPSGPAPGMSILICSLTPETRISKNSSRLDETMQRNFSRSSSGTAASSACASTRRWNSSSPSSRFRKWLWTCRGGGAVLTAMRERRLRTGLCTIVTTGGKVHGIVIFGP